VFTVSSATQHVFDLPFHFNGELMEQPEMQPHEGLGDTDGYQHLGDISMIPSSRHWPVAFRQPNQKEFRFFVLGDTETSVYLTSGLVGNPPKRLPMILLSQSGNTASFKSLIEPMGNKESITRIETEEFVSSGQEWSRFTIRRENGREVIEILQPELPLGPSETFIRFERFGK